MYLILDRGHSVDTPGKRSKRWSNGKQLIEYRFNERVIAVIEKWLKLNPDLIKYSTYPKTRFDVHRNKRKALYDRFAKIKNDSVLVISVHGDAFPPDPRAHGGTCYTSPGLTKSDTFAKYFKESFEYYKLPVRSSKEAKYTVLMGHNYYAVLLEMGFYTNFDECMYMLSEEGVRMYANVIIRGLMNIFKNE